MKSAGRRTVIHALSAMIPMALTLVILIRLDFAPWGDRSFLCVDMDLQYSAFLTYLRSILRGENDLFYSFAMNGGGNFYFLYAYYLANPLNWLMALVPAEGIPQALTFFILLRFALAGLTMSLYLRRIQPNAFGFMTLLFSTSYALMSYMAAYAENYFFIDGVVLLPLVLIGVEDLIDRKTIGTLALTTAVALCVQFYIAWMIAIFSALYCLFRLAQMNRSSLEAATLRRFAIAMTLGALAASIILIPVIDGISRIPKETSMGSANALWNFDFLDLLGKNILGAHSAPGSLDMPEFRFGFPGIYCGALITVYCALFFVSPAFRRKDKLLTGALFLILWLSFWSYPLNRAWHGFAETAGWPYRYSFVFSFWMIRTAAQRFSKDEASSLSRLFWTAALLTGICWLPLLRGFPLSTLRDTAIEWFLLMMFIVLSKPVCKRRTALILMSVLVIANQLMHLDSIHKHTAQASRSANAYIERIHSFSEVLAPLNEQRSDLYRIENLSIRDKNDPMRLGYHGLTHYSSTIDYNHVLFPLRIFGVPQYHYWTVVTPGVPEAALALFGVEAVLFRARENGLPDVRELPATLPLAFTAPQTIIRNTLFSANPYENLNTAFRALSGVNLEPIFNRVSSEESADGNGRTNWTLRMDQDALLFMYGFNNEGQTYIIETPAGTRKVLLEREESFRLGTLKRGEFLRVTAADPGSQMERFFYAEDLETLSAYARVIQPRGVPVEKVASSHLRLRLESTGEFPYLFLSIFYDEGWRATIDGQDAPIYPALNYFMMIPIDGGAHTVELRYTPPGFRLGACLSLAGCLLLMLIAWRERRSFAHP